MPFVTVDLALRTGGVRRVIELGDGQVSDRKPPSNLTVLDAALHALRLASPEATREPHCAQETVVACVTGVRTARPAFAAFWASCASGLQAKDGETSALARGERRLSGTTVLRRSLRR
ncbi:ATP-grasp domain-containing protein [Micromonospora sp. NPDC005413]|uniref:ATP-grasp domain-containing protein n=1 Tax=Micromonospora sp. NPDC005413 TaxID=3154563 RepID=UPI0033BA44A4